MANKNNEKINKHIENSDNTFSKKCTQAYDAGIIQKAEEKDQVVEKTNNGSKSHIQNSQNGAKIKSKSQKQHNNTTTPSKNKNNNHNNSAGRSSKNSQNTQKGTKKIHSFQKSQKS